MYEQLEELAAELTDLATNLEAGVSDEDLDEINNVLAKIERKIKSLRSEYSEIPHPTEA